MSDERDIVERLRDKAKWRKDLDDVIGDTRQSYLETSAADEIERLRGEVARLTEALTEIEKLWWFDGSAIEDCKSAHRIASEALKPRGPS